MGSRRAGGAAAGGGAGRGVDLVAAAAALRWARPDLTAALADHVVEEASATGEQERWLAAAGWAVHGRAATGDGREIACDVVAGLGQWDDSALAHPAARRLRVELAMVAAGAGEVEAARRLAAPVAAADDGELLADLLCVHARCAVEDAPEDVAEAIGAAGAAWAAVEGPAGELGGASVALINAVVERRAGRPAAAADRAAEGLARLERGRAASGTPSSHLGAALAAEWISALLDAGRVAEARDGCDALLPRLAERARPTRQLALLRLTVARVVAAQEEAADSTELLAQAAEDAAGSDVPDLETVCRTALGALHEKAERLDTALETLQTAVAAERRDRARSRRFAAALAELPSSTVAERAPTATQAAAIDSSTASATTTVLPAITRGDRKLVRSREELLRAEPGGGSDVRSAAERARSRFSPEEDRTGGAAADEGLSRGWGAVPWSESTGDSPIGDLLIRSMRSGSDEPGHRNGRTAGRRGEQDADEHTGRRAARRRPGRPQAREDDAAATGWIPSFDAPSSDEQPAQSRGARKRSRPDASRAAGPSRRRTRDEREAAATSPHAVPEHLEAPVTTPGLIASGAAAPDDPDDVAEERAARRRRGGAAPRRRAAAEQDAGEGRGERSATRGRHGRATEPDDGDAPVRARRAADTVPAGSTADGPGTRARDTAGTGHRGDEEPEESTGLSGAGRAGGDALDDTDPAAVAHGGGALNGRRHGAGDPWATGRWMVEPAGRWEAEADSATDHATGHSATGHSATGHFATGHFAAGHAATEHAAAEHAAAEHTAAGSSGAEQGPAEQGPAEQSTAGHRAVQDLLGDRSPSEPSGRAATQHSDSGPAGTEPGGSGSDPDSWLQAALADLDRVLGSTSLPTYRDEDPGPVETGCSVVVDIARDGRRFAGRRSRVVIRSVADRLAERLPPGAHQYFGDSDTLLISGPAWSRAEATEWMHRTLPGLLDGFVPEEDLPAAQLRAAVHDGDGPVGAQILQNLARPSGRRREAGSNGRAGGAEHESGPWSDLGGRSSEARGREHRPAGRAGRRDRADETGSDPRSRRDGSDGAGRRRPDDGPPGWPWAGADGRTDGAERRDGASEPVTAHDDEWAVGDRASTDLEAGTGRRDEGRRPAARASSAAGRADGTGDAGAVGGPGDSGGGTARSRHRAGGAHGGGAAGRSRGERTGDGRRRRREAGDVTPSGADPTGSGRGDTPRSAAEERAGTTGTAAGADRSGHRGDVRATGADSGPDTDEGRPPDTARATQGAPDAAGAGSRAGDGNGAGDEASEGTGSPRPGPEGAEPTEGLGIADLLAGALAAYRGI